MNGRWLLGLTILSLIGIAGCGATQGTKTANTVTNQGQGNRNTATNQTQAASPLVGKTAPDFSLPKLDGSGTVALKDLLGKQPIILNAWASWCGPCQRETPDLVKVAQAYAGKIQIVGVNMTHEDTISDARDFAQSYHVSYPLISDPKGQFLTTYGIFAFPTTFLISPTGKVLDARLGGMSKQQIDSLVAEAMKSSQS